MSSPVTQETRWFITGVVVLSAAYVARHWRYYVYVFPGVLLAHLHPRLLITTPLTPWGFVCRVAAWYLIYKLFKRLLHYLNQKYDEHLQRRLQRTNASRKAEAAGELQEKTQVIADAHAAVARQLAEAQAQEAYERRSQAATTRAANDGALTNVRQGKQQPGQQTAAEAAAAASSAEAVQRVRASETAQEAERAAAGQRAAQQKAWLDRLQAQADEAAAQQAEAAAAAAQKVAAEAAAKAAQASGSEPLAPPASAAAADAAAARASAAMHPSTSTGSLGSASGSRGAGSIMSVSREEALEAEERQRKYMEQLARGGPTPIQTMAIEAERRLREEQDAEYAAALQADEERAAVAAAERTAAEAAAAEQEAQLAELRELKEQLRAKLEPEPSSDSESSILVRVRLPDGTSHTRRFMPATSCSAVRDWLQGLEVFPLWQPSEWALMQSYPRMEVQGEHPLEDVAHGARQVALFVQQTAR